MSDIMLEKTENVQAEDKVIDNVKKKDEENITSTKEKQKKRTQRKTSQISKVIIVKSKRKETIARAYIKKGSGRITINSVDINALESEMTKSFILEPLSLSSAAREYAKSLDIKLNIKGGGRSAQMQAARSVIAKGLVKFTNDDSLKMTFLNYDRGFLVDNSRRVEPKKFLGTKARARFQTSYR